MGGEITKIRKKEVKNGGRNNENKEKGGSK
jgi:hypothetical protein